MLLYIKDHSEEDVWQCGIEESLCLLADFGVLPDCFQDYFCVTHQYCKGQKENHVLYVRLINVLAAEKQLFLTVCLRNLGC